MTDNLSKMRGAAAVDKFGEQGLMALLAVNRYYLLVSMTHNVERTPVPGGRPPLPIRK